MKQTHTRFSMLLLLLVMGLSNVWGDSYTIVSTKKELKSPGNITTSSQATTIFSSGTEYLTTSPVSSVTKGYYGESDKTDIRLGNNSTGGSITLTLSDAGTVNAMSIVINAKLYNSGISATLDCNTNGAQTISANYANYTYNLDGSKISSITLATTSGVLIHSITVIYYEKPLTSIAISGSPTKTTYEIDDSFDPTGLTVTGTFNDNSETTITDGIKWNVNPEKMTLTTTSVNVKAIIGSLSSEIYPVNVTITPYHTATLGSFSVTSGNINDDITYDSQKGNSSTAPYVDPSDDPNCLRLYQNGGYIIVQGKTGVKIQSITITTGSAYTLTTVGYCVDNGDVPTTGETVAKSSEYTISGLNNNEVEIYCLGTSNEHRLDIASITVKYTKEYNYISISSACTDGKRCYSTYSSTEAFVVPEYLTVSEIGINTNDNKENVLNVQSYTTGAVVPANTGVMVSADAGGDYPIELSVEEGTSVLGSNNCLLSGNYPMSEMNDQAYLFYRLTMHDGKQIGFWWGAENGGAFSIAANKAYLAVPTTTDRESESSGSSSGSTGGDNTSSAKSCYWISDSSTSISSPYIKTANNIIYNLSGQRVTKATKGIYIMDGKKYIAK